MCVCVCVCRPTIHGGRQTGRMYPEIVRCGDLHKEYYFLFASKQVESSVFFRIVVQLEAAANLSQVGVRRVVVQKVKSIHGSH